eukprot:306535-Chlamydomonas_euryale.AAC.2
MPRSDCHPRQAGVGRGDRRREDILTGLACGLTQDLPRRLRGEEELTAGACKNEELTAWACRGEQLALWACRGEELTAGAGSRCLLTVREARHLPRRRPDAQLTQLQAQLPAGRRRPAQSSTQTAAACATAARGRRRRGRARCWHAATQHAQLLQLCAQAAGCKVHVQQRHCATAAAKAAVKAATAKAAAAAAAKAVRRRLGGGDAPGQRLQHRCLLVQQLLHTRGVRVQHGVGCADTRTAGRTAGRSSTHAARATVVCQERV